MTKALKLTEENQMRQNHSDNSSGRNEKLIALFCIFFGLIFALSIGNMMISHDSVTLAGSYLCIAGSLLFIGMGVFVLIEKKLKAWQHRKAKALGDVLVALKGEYVQAFMAGLIVGGMVIVGGVFYARQLIMEILHYSSGTFSCYLYLLMDLVIIGTIAFSLMKSAISLKRGENLRMLTDFLKNNPMQSQEILKDVSDLYYGQEGMHNLYVNDKYLLALHSKSLIFLPCDQLLWIFLRETQTNQTTLSTINFAVSNGEIYSFQLKNRNMSQETQDYIGSHLPWLVYGYETYFQDEFQYNRDNMIRQIRKRREDYQRQQGNV